MNIKNEIINGYLHTFGIEFFAANHCNLKCFGCSQSSPYLDEHFADLSVFKKSLQILGKYMRPNKITILGGEPLLHPEIDDVVKIAKESAMFNEIHIATNGLNLLKMSPAFWSDIDLVRISKYPTTSAFINKNLPAFREKCADNQVELQIREMNNFNYIILSEEITDKSLVDEIYQNCIYKYYCHNLTNDKIFRCSPVVNMKKYQSVVNKGKMIDGTDYLKIEDSVSFKNDLFNYLSSDIPLNGCKFCLGSSGKSFPHRQLLKKEILNPEITFLSSENY